MLRFVVASAVVAVATASGCGGEASKPPRDWEKFPAVAVVTPLIFHRLIRFTRLAFLYVRPSAFRLVPARANGLNTRLPEGQLAGVADS